MQLVVHLPNDLDDVPAYLEEMQAHGVQEVLLGPMQLSRFSNYKLPAFLEIWKQVLASKIRPILEWDILMTEKNFEWPMMVLIQLELGLLSKLGGGIRVQDPGACEFIHTHYPDLPIQLILETGHHNAEAILAWTDTYGKQIERVALSLELPGKDLGEMLKMLRLQVSSQHLQFEYLGLGPILLFHSPRALLAPYAEEEGPVLMYADSEETAHKNFLMLENAHGTFMFHPKHHGVLDYWSELESYGVSFLRLDLRFLQKNLPLPFWTSLFVYPRKSEELYIEFAGRALIRGYFHVNKSDEQFKFLKNKHLKKDLEADTLTFWPEVLSSEKGLYTAIVVKRGLEIQGHHRPYFVTAEGKRFGIDWPPLKDFLGNEQKLRDFQVDDVVFMPFLKGVGPRSNVFLQEVSDVLR